MSEGGMIEQWQQSNRAQSVAELSVLTLVGSTRSVRIALAQELRLFMSIQHYRR